MMRRTAQTFALAALWVSLFSSGCDFGNPSENVSGTWIDSQGKVYAAGHIEKLEFSPSKGSLSLRLFQVLGSATENFLQVSFNTLNQTVILEFEKLSSRPIHLKLSRFAQQVFCGEGRSEEYQVKICSSLDNFDLDAFDPSGALKLSIHLGRGTRFTEPLTSEVTLDEALGRARFESYAILQDAQKMYRSRQAIQVARAALLPHFSGQTAISLGIIASTTPTIFSAYSVLALLDSFLPFIYPSNWYKWKESKVKYLAETVSYSALRGNQVLAAEVLFYAIQKDYTLIQKTQTRLESLYDARKAILVQAELGLIDDQKVSKMDMKVLNYERDLSALKSLYGQELAIFSESIGFHPIPAQPLSLASVSLPQPVVQEVLIPRNFYRFAQESSLEIKALKYLKEAARIHAKAEEFSFLYPGAVIYLDASYMARNRIALSLEREIDLKIEEALAIVEQKSVEVSTKFNSVREDYFKLEEVLALYEADLERVSFSSHFTIEQIDELEDARDKIFETEVRIVENQYAQMMTQAIYERLVLEGIYKNFRWTPPQDRLIRSFDTD